MGMTYEPPTMPEAAAIKYPFFWICDAFPALATNGKTANNSPIAQKASIIKLNFSPNSKIPQRKETRMLNPERKGEVLDSPINLTE